MEDGNRSLLKKLPKFTITTEEIEFADDDIPYKITVVKDQDVSTVPNDVVILPSFMELKMYSTSPVIRGRITVYGGLYLKTIYVLESVVLQVESLVADFENRFIIVRHNVQLILWGIGRNASQLKELPDLTGAQMSSTMSLRLPVDRKTAVGHLMASGKTNILPLIPDELDSASLGAVRQMVFSLYCCHLFYVVPEEIAEELVTAVKACGSDVDWIVNQTQPQMIEVAKAIDKKISLNMAFLLIACLGKHVDCSTRGWIDDWANRRLAALYVKLNGAHQIKANHTYHDLQLITTTWRLHPAIRRAFANVLLFTENSDPLWSVLQSEWQIVLRYAGMTDLFILYQFGIMKRFNESISNSQMKNVEMTIDKLKETYGLDKLPYVALFDSYKSSVDSSRFPLLLRRALEEKQSTRLGSWKLNSTDPYSSKLELDVPPRLFYNTELTEEALLSSIQLRVPAVVPTPSYFMP